MVSSAGPAFLSYQQKLRVATEVMDIPFDVSKLKVEMWLAEKAQAV